MVSSAMKKGKKSYTHLTSFFMSNWWMDCKNIKKNFFFTVAFWDNPHYPFWDEHGQSDKSEKKLGYDINYLSIWPFMGHPWFPTRKASKLTFICFQHQVLNTLQGLDNWSWKQIKVSFEVFLVGNQGWHIKGQMLR